MRKSPGSRRLRRFDGVLVPVAFAAAFAVVAGFFGHLLPVLDSIGQFRAHLSVGLVVFGIALLGRRFVLAGFSSLVTAALGLQSVLPFMLPLAGTQAGTLPDEIRRYSLLQMNLRFDARDKAGAIERIRALDPDVVTLEEITPEWETDLRGIADRYPYLFHCAPDVYEGDVAILSRRPFLDGARETCVGRSGFEARTVDFDGHPVTIGAQHLRWPWPGRQWRQIAEVEAALAALETPLLIGGDFNAAPWSAAVGRYAAAARLRVVAGIGPTYGPIWLPSGVARYAGLPIDNVLVSNEIVVLSVTRPAATDSDHLPVLVTFAIPFARPAEPEVRSVERR